MPTVPLYIRSKQFEQLRELERILHVPWQEIVRTAIQEFLTRNTIEDIKRKVEAKARGKRAPAQVP